MTNIQQVGLNTKNATTHKPSELHFGIDWSCKKHVQQNPVGSDPVGSEPHWEAILNFKKKFEISDFTRFLSDFT